MWTCCNHSEKRRLFQGKKGKYFPLMNKQMKNGCTVLSIWRDFLALTKGELRNRGLSVSFNSTEIYVLNANTFQKIKATSILTVLLFFVFLSLSVATAFMTMKTFSQQMLTYGPAQPPYRPSQPILVTIREHEIEINNSAISDLKPTPIFLTQLPKLLQKQHHALKYLKVRNRKNLVSLNSSRKSELDVEGRESKTSFTTNAQFPSIREVNKHSSIT